MNDELVQEEKRWLSEPIYAVTGPTYGNRLYAKLHSFLGAKAVLGRLRNDKAAGYKMREKVYMIPNPQWVLIEDYNEPS